MWSALARQNGLKLVLSLLIGGRCLAAAERPVWACAACGCGDPTLTAMGVEKPFKNRIRLSLEERVSGERDASVDERFLLSRTSFTASWSPTGWLTFGATLPLLAGEQRVPNEAPRRMIGLGDLEVYARALVFRDRRFSPRHIIGLLGGVKFPTGPRVNDSSGYPVSDDFQPGSGSFDPIFGVSYAYFGSRLSLFSSLSYRHTTPGWNSYQRGAELGATVLLQSSVGQRVALGMSLDLRHNRPDVYNDRALDETGGTVLSMTPQVLIALNPDWLLRGALQLPVGQWWHGGQFEYPTGIVSLIADL